MSASLAPIAVAVFCDRYCPRWCQHDGGGEDGGNVAWKPQNAPGPLSIRRWR